MRWILSIGFLLCGLLGQAQQNLLPNHSFEENTDCPDGRGDITLVLNWEKVGGGGLMDYFHECGTDCCWLYDNVLGGQLPYDGQAYVSISLLHNNHSIPGVIEGNFLGVNLTESLLEGHKYDVQFYLSLGDSCRFAGRNIGVHFSQAQPDDIIEELLALEPQVRYEGGFLADKEDWMGIEGSFIAQGGETYMTIGNFDGAENSDTLNLHEGGVDPNEGYWEVGFYFLDDVSVIEDTSYHVGVDGQLTMDNGQLSIYPNPASEYLNVSADEPIQSYRLFDMSGRELLNHMLVGQRSEFQVSVEGLPTGVYLLKTRTADGAVIMQKFMIIHSLMR